MSDRNRAPAAFSPQTADIFCTVIDNFGDAGICWRLARRFTALGLRVRLVADRIDVLAKLAPGAADGACVDGIETADWQTLAHAADPAPADLVIETFGCRLPENVERAMAAKQEAGQASFYFNLDYLSAEDWVEGSHNIWGLHPTLPIKKLWFFPGFTDRTGGVLIEDDYLEREAAFKQTKDEWIASLGGDPALPTLFIFSYPHNPTDALARALAEASPMNVLLAPGGGSPRFEAAAQAARTPHRLLAPGFLPQADFDKLLWASDAAVIRGEDSFVRAQLAGVPIIWSTYFTEDGAHRVKMDAWLARMAPRFAPEDMAGLFTAVNRAWLDPQKASGDLEALLVRFWNERGRLQIGARRIREDLFARGDLARRMLERAAQSSQA